MERQHICPCLGQSEMSKLWVSQTELLFSTEESHHKENYETKFPLQCWTLNKSYIIQL